MLAAREGYLEIVRMLVIAGADVNTRSESGETALSLARKRKNSDKHSATVELLEQHGARN
jgi:ankyrin repeat protein